MTTQEIHLHLRRRHPDRAALPFEAAAAGQNCLDAGSAERRRSSRPVQIDHVYPTLRAWPLETDLHLALEPPVVTQGLKHSLGIGPGGQGHQQIDVSPGATHGIGIEALGQREALQHDPRDTGGVETVGQFSKLRPGSRSN